MSLTWDVSGTVLCKEMTDLPTLPDMCFPGDFCLSTVMGSLDERPTFADMVLKQFQQMGPAMSGLQPFFTVLDFALSIFKCVEAIPDSITSLNPKKLIDCMPPLVEIIQKFMEMIPQLSIPRMVKNLIDSMEALLRSIADEFKTIQNEIERIQKQISRAADLGDVALADLMACSQKTMEDKVEAMSAALQGIGRMILLVNIFIGLFGGPEVPCFGSLISDNISSGIDPVIDLLYMVADLLAEISALIPDPLLSLTLALGGESC